MYQLCTNLTVIEYQLQKLGQPNRSPSVYINVNTTYISVLSQADQTLKERIKTDFMINLIFAMVG